MGALHYFIAFFVLSLCIIPVMGVVGQTTPVVDSPVVDAGSDTGGEISDLFANRRIPLSGELIPSDEYAPGRILVKFKTPGITSQSQVSAESDLNSISGATVIADYSGLGDPGLHLVNVTRLSVPDAVSMYEQSPYVEYAEPDYILHIPEDESAIDSSLISPASVTPNDPSYNLLWGLHNTGQTGGSADADIDAPEAWRVETGSANTVIAVIDTGVTYTHPDLAANMWVNTGEIPGNGIDDDGNGYVDDIRGWDYVNNDNNPMDDNNHGTHCAGTIAGVGNNGIGVTGINWNAKIMPLKFLANNGSGWTSDAVSAILYANQMGASVISNSWGGSSFSQSLQDAIDASSAVVICAAGNSGNNTDLSPQYPSACSSSNIIAVAATDDTDQLASFSNYGALSVDVAAPGVDIYSTTVAGYGYLSGTSMATPHVAGLAGLLKSTNPALTNLQIRDYILSSVDPVGSLSGKVATGGRVNADKAINLVGHQAPVVTGISPSSGYQGQSVQITNLSGVFNTAAGSTMVVLSKPDQVNLSMTGVQVPSEGRITGDLFISSNTTTGPWQVAVQQDGLWSNGNVTFTIFEDNTTLPQVTTLSSSSVNSTHAIISGNLISTGNQTCTVWLGYSQNLTGSYAYTSNQTLTLPSQFNATLFNLTPQTQYFFKTYAVNSVGSVNGSVLSFTTISLGQHPVANFTANNTVVTVGEVISFSDHSINASGWDWKFGDTHHSTLQHPSHAYNLAGLYSVNLTVTNPYGSDSLNRSGYILVTDSPSPTQYVINASAGIGGTISPSGSVFVNRSADQAFMITASSGYAIGSVVVDGFSVGSVSSYTFSNVSSNHTISANFTAVSPSTFVINASAGIGGTISPSGSVSVNRNEDQAFVITPSSGYSIGSVVVDGFSVGSVSSYLFSNVSSDHTISANFTAVLPSQYVINASAGFGGSISPSGSVIVNRSAVQAFVITPSSGYSIGSVVVDGASVGSVSSYSFSNVSSNHTISANFTVAPDSIYVINASAGIGGSINPSGSVFVNRSADQAFVIAPSSGYSIGSVVVDGVSVGSVSSYLFSNVSSDHTISANFTAVLPSQYVINASAGLGGTISPSGSVIVNRSSDQAFVITPSSGYSIGSVVVDGVSVGSVSSYLFSNVSSDHTISANFTAVLPSQYVISASAGLGGTISPSGSVIVNRSA
ncbi:MAG TPA: S8 family serine peptidase, partial [Methanospirillum sp.]|nr:S8 family serine peptidase [Methanospirillum sp.]